VEHVDGAEKALYRGPADAAPALAPVVREREEAQARLDRYPGKRGRDPPLSLRARRRERNDLVLGPCCKNETGEGAADVVAHPGPRVRERRDVEGDPHYDGL
jgi:hypothetical protein